VYPAEIAEVMFAIRQRVRYTSHRPVCVACEQTDRDDRKRQRRAVAKAHDTTRFHARRHGMGKAEFAAQYGWRPERIAHDIEHAYDNTCCYCQRPYAAMGHGLADVTIDVIDPTKEPFYETNTRPCCMTCNREKGPLTPEQFGRRKQGWRLWEEHRRIGPKQLGLAF